MRVGIIALLHESNTFITQPTTIEHFRQNLLVTGDEVRQRMAATHHEVGGFFDGLAEAEIEAVPVFAARAVPFGVITKDAFQQLVDTLFDALSQAGQLDGLLVAPHGATVSEAHPDADGFWLAEVRNVVGPRTPVIGTLDPHANLSQAMVDATNALVAYRSNPHLDQRARGREAAGLMARVLRGEIRPTQAAAFPPAAMNIECQESTAEPCLSLYRRANEALCEPGVLSNSILLGFPYADVAEMGSSFITVTDNNETLARAKVTELAAYFWENRAQFDRPMLGIEQALDQASALEGPVCLLDMGDNVGGGSPGDGTLLAHAIHRRQHKMDKRGQTPEEKESAEKEGADPVCPAFVCLYDPASAEHAANAGVGSRVRLQAGGKTDQLHGEPLDVEVTVRGIYDGKFEEPQPRHGGFTKCDQGRTAVVETERGLTIMLTSRRMPPFSLCQLTSCNVDPKRFHLLVAKGVNAPVAAYAPVCRHLIRVNTPGVTTADMKSLDFQHRRRPMFPFEPDATWDVS